MNNKVGQGDCISSGPSPAPHYSTCRNLLLFSVACFVLDQSNLLSSVLNVLICEMQVWVRAGLCLVCRVYSLVATGTEVH